MLASSPVAPRLLVLVLIDSASARSCAFSIGSAMAALSTSSGGNLTSAAFPSGNLRIAFSTLRANGQRVDRRIWGDDGGIGVDHFSLSLALRRAASATQSSLLSELNTALRVVKFTTR
jgi:hypothetical protein